MKWLERLARTHPAVAPRADPPRDHAAAERAVHEAKLLRNEVAAREPTIAEIAAELRSERQRNHIPERVRASMRGRTA